MAPHFFHTSIYNYICTDYSSKMLIARLILQQYQGSGEMKKLTLRHGMRNLAIGDTMRYCRQSTSPAKSKDSHYTY